MATQLKLRGGTTAEHATFTGGEREVTVDTDKNTLVLHDGVTAGGIEMLNENSAAAVNITTWSITETGGNLYFAVGGVNKMKLDSNGNLDVAGDMNTSATIT
jgi:hypothetical protein